MTSADMSDERTVTTEEGEAFAAQFKMCGFMEASAKQRINIDQAFEEVVTRIVQKQDAHSDARKQSNCILS